MIFLKGQKMTVGSYCVSFFDINGGSMHLLYFRLRTQLMSF